MCDTVLNTLLGTLEFQTLISGRRVMRITDCVGMGHLFNKGMKHAAWEI